MRGKFSLHGGGDKCFHGGGQFLNGGGDYDGGGFFLDGGGLGPDGGGSSPSPPPPQETLVLNMSAKNVWKDFVDHLPLTFDGVFKYTNQN